MMLNNVLLKIIELFSNINNRYKKVKQDDTELLEESTLLSTKIELDTLGTICFKLLKDNMTYLFGFNILINIIFCSFFIPFLIKLSNDTMIMKIDNKSNIDLGLVYVGIAIFLEIVSVMHKNFIIEKHKRMFHTNIHTQFENMINNLILEINWHKLRELNKNDFDRKKDMAKWFLLSFINMIINTFMNLFSFFGYTIWIWLISPVSILIYIVVLSFWIYFFQVPNKKNKDIYQKLWDRYYAKQNDMYNEITHLKGDKCMNDIRKIICDIEEFRNDDKKKDTLFVDMISVVYNFAFLLNCLIIHYNKLPIQSIIIYIQYSFLMKNSISNCID